ncbi:unnamed protein product [Parnassius mnemosyne]|uniref:Uncharacterized protein n=1 Tax=Parnassius mnemosyne TaxID=213953 RepID=A0AAV1LXR7_9NEOP
MECPLKWTILKFITILLLNNHQVLSQNTSQGAPAVPSGPIIYRECVKEGSNSNNPSPTPQLLNTVLTIAAAKGVLPDILPQIQPTRTVSPETQSTTQEFTQKNIAIVPTSQSSSFYQQEPVFATTQSVAPAIPNTNAIIPTSSTAYTHSQLAKVLTVPPLIISPGLNQGTQQNNPFIPSISEFAQPQSTVLIPQINDEPCHCFQISEKSEEMTSAPALPLESTPSTFEITNGLNLEPICTNSILTTEYGQSFPINLQISIPPPNVEAPRITFINAALPTPSPEKTASVDVNSFTNPNWFSNGYLPPAPPQQVIIKKKKSLLKDWLPIMLLAMFNNDRESCINAGCCCCCPCNSGGGNSIPIPYPIPIPINNPIINSGFLCPKLSRNQDSKSNRYDDDDDDDD